MATIVPRSSVVEPGQSIQLMATFRGPDGKPTDLDAFPMITIIQPSNGVALGPTSAGVFHNSIGQYGFIYPVCLNPPVGTWTDIWQGSLSGFAVTGEFTFTVYTTQLPATSKDGYVSLGDKPGYQFSQTAIKNINNIIELVRQRMKSAGKHKTTDKFGNVTYEDCDIFTTDQLVAFAIQALGEFNQIPHFTLFTFDDQPIIDNFFAVLVQGASLMALSSQALIERGREYTISDQGIGFSPPGVSELLNSQWGTELANWYEQVTMIKKNCKPSPIGLGTLTISARAPQLSRLRMLRARQIF